MFEGHLQSFVIAMHTIHINYKYANVSPDNFWLLRSNMYYNSIKEYLQIDLTVLEIVLMRHYSEIL